MKGFLKNLAGTYLISRISPIYLLLFSIVSIFDSLLFSLNLRQINFAYLPFFAKLNSRKNLFPRKFVRTKIFDKVEKWPPFLFRLTRYCLACLNKGVYDPRLSVVTLLQIIVKYITLYFIFAITVTIHTFLKKQLHFSDPAWDLAKKLNNFSDFFRFLLITVNYWHGYLVRKWKH